MPVKAPRLQPATREKTCQVCGTSYTYPTRGSTATRHYCELCNALSPELRKTLTRLAKRVQQLERTLARLEKANS